jgi:hypothetical protein
MDIKADHVTVTVYEGIDPAMAAKLDSIYDLSAGLKEWTVTNQEKINAIAAAIDAGVTGIRADIDALKAQRDAGEVLDFTTLEAKVAALQALDAENPPAPSA